MDCFVAKASGTTHPIHPVETADFKKWLKHQSRSAQNWIRASRFEAKPGSVCLIPGKDGQIASVALGVDAQDATWSYSALVAALPEGRYKIEPEPVALEANRAALGFALACYRFDRYKADEKKRPVLVWPKNADQGEVTRLAEGTFLVRDLVNTPTEDMGPSELEREARKLAKKHGARISVIKGKQLLEKNYPTIHTVGRASDDDPRLIDIKWGSPRAPKVTLVGKGVCFDTGGLNLKTGNFMTLMKKDMGGAAHVLGLAHAIMDAGLPVRLRVLVPAVENSVAGNAFRPLDVITTRAGLTVEVGNTDAEGRLVLCDALAEADREDPDLILDFATLTGAARVALGPEVPVLFSNDDDFAEELLAGGRQANDVWWRLPLHQDYKRFLDSRVADLNNVSRQSYGGAITAALFLQQFVREATPWAHVDVMAWNLEDRPGRPVGGEAMGLRAAYTALKTRYLED